MKKIFSFLIFSLSLECFSQSTNENYIQVQSLNIPVTSVATANTLSIPDDSKSVTYFDGLGRECQKISVKAFNNKDLIQPIEYDNLGRVAKQYLPYVSGTSDGSFNGNYSGAQLLYYDPNTSNDPTIPHDLKPYSEVKYEASPLGKIIEQSPTGYDWKFGTGHTQTMTYLYNEYHQIKKWKIIRFTDGSIIGANATEYWNPGGLSKQEVIDEDGKISREYTDAEGKSICKEVLAATNQQNETYDFSNGSNETISYKKYLSYNVYDELGRLIYFLPAKFVILDMPFFEGDSYFEDYVYAYRYDDKGRQVAKHVPGSGWTYTVYNNRDLPILSQSEKERAESPSLWLFTKYDDMGRVIMTGKCNTLDGSGNAINEYTHVQLFIDQETEFAETRTIQSAGTYFQGYTCNTYPLDNMITEVLVVKYYDDYDFSFDGVLHDRTYQPTTAYPEFSSNLLGLPIASKVKILGSPDYLYTLNYYNEDGQLIQQQQQTQLSYPDTWDIINNEYFFNGQVKSVNRNHASTSSPNIFVNTRYKYDHLGRLQYIFKKINTDPEIILSYNEYNGIGQLVRKTLHYDPVWNDPFLQGIDYRYNIRGWLTNINNAGLTFDGNITNSDLNDRFGEEIFYENVNISNSAFTSAPQFNGNISAIKWRSQGNLYTTYHSRPIHAYVYRYDDFNRLTAGYYACNSDAGPTQFDHDINAFRESERYSLGGDIQSLFRNSKIGNIDNLAYSYSNDSKLKSVTDNADVHSELTNEFHDLENQAIEYSYDPNGSLIEDKNKGITAITYNYLNLPETLTDQNGNTVTYTYDATGTKLSKTFNGNTHYYVNGAEYENHDLLFIATEEGRVRMKNSDALNTSDYVYDYFLKDHLGNVRVTLTTEIRNTEYYATMEAQNRAVEDSLFQNIDTTAHYKPPSEPGDPAYNPDNEVSQLSALSSEIGISKILSVSAEDVLDFSVKYYFENMDPVTVPIDVTDLLTQLANTFANSPASIPGSTFETRQKMADFLFTSNSDVNNFLYSSLSNGNLNDPISPQSFLTYLFFDNEFHFHADVSGIMQASDPNTLGNLAILGLQMPDNGYFYIYTNNHSNIAVNFNNMQIHQHSGEVLEENHYYPYGLLIEQLTSSHPSYHQYNKYQNKELQDDISQNMLDFGARQYDAVLGRWHVQDPAHQFANPYLAMANNPARFVDPDGRFVWFLPLLIGAATYGLSTVTSHQKFSWEGLITSVAFSYMSAGVAEGIGSMLGHATGSVTTELERAALHGITGGMFSMKDGVNWSNFGSGFASGFVSSVYGSSVSGVEFGAAKIGGASLFGGLSSSAFGGNFWDGAAQGATIEIFNHMGNEIEKKQQVRREEKRKNAIQRFIKYVDDGGSADGVNAGANPFSLEEIKAGLNVAAIFYSGGTLLEAEAAGTIYLSGLQLGNEVDNLLGITESITDPQGKIVTTIIKTMIDATSVGTGINSVIKGDLNSIPGAMMDSYSAHDDITRFFKK
jgi:RHS repeat-associated protein